MRIFAIAPQMGHGSGILAVEEELAAFVQYHDIAPHIPLIDFVVSSDITHEVSQAGDCEMFAILSHADEHGVELSDGSYLDAETIGQYARVLNAKFIYLNTCDSALFISRLSLITHCTIIYTAGQVTDTEAIRFGVLFAKELAATGSVEGAFNLVAPRDRKYRLYNPKANEMGIDELGRQIAALAQQMGALTQQMASLTQQVSGNSQQLVKLDSKVDVEIRVIQERHLGNRELIQTIQAQIQAIQAHTQATQRLSHAPIHPSVILGSGLFALSLIIVMVVIFWR